MIQNEKDKKRNDEADIEYNESDILEQGDIYFFYRPKKNSSKVKDIDDIRRFFMVTAPDKQNNNKYTSKNTRGKFYRLFVIGKKALPEIRKSEARASERYWARVGGIFEDQNDLAKELFSDEFREGDAARPVGAGKYVIVRHQKHAEIAYILETPYKPGDAQEELGIEKEASYIISVINPKSHVPEGFPSAEEHPKYPEEVLKEFDESENFTSLFEDTRLIDFPNAQVILIGAREGKDIIKDDLGIDIDLDDDNKRKKDLDILNKLKTSFKNVPTKPLTEGRLE